MNKNEFIDRIKSYLPYDHKIDVKNCRSLISVTKYIFKTVITINPVFIKADDKIIMDIITFIKDFNDNNKINNIKKRLTIFYETNKKIRNITINHSYLNKNLFLLFCEVIDKIKKYYIYLDYSVLKITWGKKSNTRSRSIRFGSFDRKNKIIRIHPTLDDPIVPDYFVKSIIYHEVAHFLYDEIYHDNKTYHNKYFYEILKKNDENYKESNQWEKKNKNIFFDN